MRSLATALGTGPSTLYWHVHDKEDLLLLILDETVRPIRVPVPEVGTSDLRRPSFVAMRRCFPAQLSSISCGARRGTWGPKCSGWPTRSWDW